MAKKVSKGRNNLSGEATSSVSRSSLATSKEEQNVSAISAQLLNARQFAQEAAPGFTVSHGTSWEDYCRDALAAYHTPSYETYLREQAEDDYNEDMYCRSCDPGSEPAPEIYEDAGEAMPVYTSDELHDTISSHGQVPDA